MVSMHQRKIRHLTLYAVMIWLCLISGSFFVNWQHTKHNIHRMAVIEARSNFNKDLVYRRWATQHGGVYVPPTEQYPPNPYLSHIEQRDVVTASGQLLTLTNPAYMTRQVHALAEEQYGLKGHITSLNPLRPRNAPDPWEYRALQAFAAGAPEVISLETIKEKPYLRFMKPMFTEEGCLKCHARQGYELGDLRGGISVSVPYTPYLAMLSENRTVLASAHALIGGLGLLGIGFSSRRLSQSQKDLQQSEQRHRLALQAANDGIWEWDVKNDTTFVSDRWRAIIGIEKTLSEAELTYDVWASRIHPEDYQRVTEIISSSLKTGERYTLVYRLRHPSGENRWLRSVGEPQHDPAGEAVTLHGYTTDITERKNAEEQLALKEHKYRTLLNSQQDAVFLHKLQEEGFSSFIEVNNAAIERYGYSKDELLSMNPFDITVREQVEKHAKKDFRSRLIKEQHLTFETVHIRKSGDQFPVEVTATITELNGERYILSIVRDMTERNRLNAELQQKHKMEAIGTLAGGIAHNFNNNLSIILGAIDMAKLKMSDEEVVPYLDKARIGTLRSRDLVKRLMLHSRQSESQMYSLKVPEVIRETLDLLEDTLPSSIMLKTDVQSVDNNLSVHGNAGQIQECLINLCNNAVHAMEEQGELTITLETVVLEEAQIPVNFTAEPGPYARLSVRDTGCGMDQATQERVFDLFFTTKETHQGTGIGLSTVMGIVKSHGGLIKLHSIPGEGSSFELYFPIHRQNRFQPDSKRSEIDVIPTGSEQILLVEDEQILADLAQAMLEELGYRVTTLTDSMKAATMFMNNSEQFQLLISDQIMPDLSGIDLIRRVRAIRPELPAILCTGYSSLIDGNDAQQNGIDAFIHKPLDLRQMAQTVRMVLDQGADC